MLKLASAPLLWLESLFSTKDSGKLTSGKDSRVVADGEELEDLGEPVNRGPRRVAATASSVETATTTCSMVTCRDWSDDEEYPSRSFGGATGDRRMEKIYCSAQGPLYVQTARKDHTPCGVSFAPKRGMVPDFDSTTRRECRVDRGVDQSQNRRGDSRCGLIDISIVTPTSNRPRVVPYMPAKRASGCDMGWRSLDFARKTHLASTSSSDAPLEWTPHANNSYVGFEEVTTIRDVEEPPEWSMSSGDTFLTAYSTNPEGSAVAKHTPRSDLFNGHQTGHCIDAEKRA